jgi:hypothetical protein
VLFDLDSLFWCLEGCKINQKIEENGKFSGLEMKFGRLGNDEGIMGGRGENKFPPTLV